MRSNRILARCDVFPTNIRPDALARMKPRRAKSRRDKQPALIHCTISGYGPDGPYRGRPAYDTVLQAASGLAGLFGGARWRSILRCSSQRIMSSVKLRPA